MGEGGHKSTESCIIGEVESVGTVCVGILLRMGFDPFLMSVYEFFGGGETLWEQNGLPWEHSAENQWEEGKPEIESLIM